MTVPDFLVAVAVLPLLIVSLYLIYFGIMLMLNRCPWPFRPVALLLAALPLAGCDSFLATGASYEGSPPIVRATDRGTASLMVQACPMGPAGGAVLAEYLQTLSASAPIVTASARANSRLILNLCSPVEPEVVRAAAALRPRLNRP